MEHVVFTLSWLMVLTAQWVYWCVGRGSISGGVGVCGEGCRCV